MRRKVDNHCHNFMHAFWLRDIISSIFFGMIQQLRTFLDLVCREWVFELTCLATLLLAAFEIWKDMNVAKVHLNISKENNLHSDYNTTHAAFIRYRRDLAYDFHMLMLYFIWDNAWLIWLLPNRRAVAVSRVSRLGLYTGPDRLSCVRNVAPDTEMNKTSDDCIQKNDSVLYRRYCSTTSIGDYRLTSACVHKPTNSLGANPVLHGACG